MKTYESQYEYSGPRKIRVDYNSLEQFIADISTTDYPRQSSDKKSKPGRASWSGSASIKTAISEAREGLNLGQVELGVIKNEHLHDQINRSVYAVSGGTVDVGMFLTGEPECMVDFQTEDAPRFVTINVDVCESSGTPDEVFTRKAIACACLVDELENNNFRVKLNAICNIKNIGGVDLLASVTIKDYQQKLSIAQITGCISQGFFRRLMFCFVEKYSPMDPENHCYGYPSTEYEGIEGVVIKNTRNGVSLHSDSAIKNYVRTYTEQIYELSAV